MTHVDETYVLLVIETKMAVPSTATGTVVTHFLLATSCIIVSCFALFFYTEDGGDMFHLNVG
jgi:hypothetical protein